MRRLTRGARVPEESLAGRMAVLAAAVVADLAMALTAGALLTTVVSLAVVVLGHRVSWRGRHRPRTAAGQAVLGVLLLFCLAYLVADLTTGVFGGALPQAKFAVVTQAVTSFDLKSRRNLFTHLWHSAVILYVGAVFAWDPTFLPFVLAWAACVFAFLYLTRGRASRAPRRRMAAWAAAWLVISGGLFVGIPHFAGRPLAVPLLVSMPMTADASAEVLPSVLPLVGGAPASTEESINLRVRGRLGEEVMFRVRSPAAAYWRAYTLQQYTGQSWSRVPAAARPIPPVSVGLEATDEGPAIGTLPQSFFLERSVPSDVILAYPPKELYFPARGLLLLPTGTIRSPVPLRRGMNYSGVSAVRDVSPAHLRMAAPIDTVAEAEYLELPRSVPRRVGDLAQRVTSGSATEYDAVQAVTDYLRTNERYSLDTPRLPAGADAVDQFVFVDHVGFCEQFASALSVMLRSVGIPSRLAVGYSTGERDALTGTFTVRARDAHAWVEVLFPGVGWVPFDASPGFTTIPANRLPAHWLLSDLSPQVALTGLGGAPGGGAGVGLALVVLAAVILLAWRALRYRREGHSPALRAYLWAQLWLRLMRLPPRRAPETPREHLVRLEAVAPRVAMGLQPIVQNVESAVYRGLRTGGGSSLPVLWAGLLHQLRITRARSVERSPA